jgi:protein tyrosine/serine phosphatase
VKDQANAPIYVHCAGGRHRTGIVTAVYRMTFEGWNIEKAYDEMKDYDFYTRWGHGAMKKFVFNYWNELQTKRLESPLTPSATTVLP